LTAQVMYNSILAKEAYLLCYDIVVYVSYLWPALNYRKGSRKLGTHVHNFQKTCRVHVWRSRSHTLEKLMTHKLHYSQVIISPTTYYNTTIHLH